MKTHIVLVALLSTPLEVSVLCNSHANPFCFGVTRRLNHSASRSSCLNRRDETSRQLGGEVGKVINHLAMAPIVFQKRASLF